jgi:UDP-2,3-diacylglucosamine hydrolase
MQGRDVYIVTLEGSGEPLISFPGMVAKPERLNDIFTALRQRNISDLVLIGRMKRPKVFELRPDLFTLKLIPKIIYQLLMGGDDALLRSVREMLEGQGFVLHAAQEFVSGLTAPAGPFSKKNPDANMLKDIRVGIDAALAHGAKDAGQAVVVRYGKVVGREDARGTDALISRCRGADNVLVKMAKPQQDKALDLPSIGPDTVRNCAHAGFLGIAVEAGATLVAERDTVVQLADQYGLFLIGVK